MKTLRQKHNKHKNNTKKTTIEITKGNKHKHPKQIQNTRRNKH